MRYRITTALAALAFAVIGTVGLAPAASAAAEDCTSWHSASWGKGQVCYDADYPYAGGFDMRAAVDDTATDGYCVYIQLKFANAGWVDPVTTPGDYSCGPVEYHQFLSFSDGGAFRGMRIRRGPWGSYLTVCEDNSASAGECPPR